MSKYLFKSSNICNDLIRLIKLLKNLKLSNVNVDGLEKLETELKNKHIKPERWKLTTRLTFKNINKGDLKIPETIEKCITEILLDMKVHITETSCNISNIEDSIQQDSNTSYGVQLVTYGKSKSKESNFKMAWHLDKHIRSEEGNGRGKGFIHPEYHFNMGGFALTKDEAVGFGNVLIMDTPRLVHPPLDIVLSIDFVLKNFYGVRVKNLTDSRQYNTIINNAKVRLWRPYFISLADYYESNQFTHLKIDKSYAPRILGDK